MRQPAWAIRMARLGMPCRLGMPVLALSVCAFTAQKHHVCARPNPTPLRRARVATARAVDLSYHAAASISASISASPYSSPPASPAARASPASASASALSSASAAAAAAASSAASTADAEASAARLCSALSRSISATPRRMNCARRVAGAAHRGCTVRGVGSGMGGGGEGLALAVLAHPPSSLSRVRRPASHREPPSAHSEERPSLPRTRGRAPSARERSRRAAACDSTGHPPIRSAPQARRRRAPAITSAITSQPVCTQQPFVALEGMRRRRYVRSGRVVLGALPRGCSA